LSCFIIAEAGINHEGNIETAKSLANFARICGASAVKFQTWFRDWPDLEYLKFTKDQWRELFAFCDSIGFPWFSTPFDIEAIHFLKECGMRTWKVSSGMMVNEPFLYELRKVIGEDRLIISTGMSRESEIWNLMKFFRRPELLYCVSLYPADPGEIDLTQLKSKWYFSGFSDHTPDDEIAIAAVVLGANIIEKHLTLDRTLPGPDHQASLDPLQFANMVRRIRNVEQALRPKPMSEREHAQREAIRKRMAF